MILYYITDRGGFGGDQSNQMTELLKRIAAAAASGVDYIQLREKDLSTRELEHLTHEAVAAVRTNSSTTRLLINDRSDVALACGADGVHLPGNSLPASEVRSACMKSVDHQAVISVSVHSIGEVRHAEAHGADFAVLAPIFEKPGTDLRGLGLDALMAACRSARAPDNTESAPQNWFPVLALGGVNLGNALACLRAGAAGVAGIRLFQQGNVVETVRTLRRLAL
jgi:thiamine-phosphate pyrophosphorylase